MTAENEDTDETGSGFEFPDDRDWILGIIVNLVNTTKLGIGVTLHVGGLLVTGTIGSGADYVDEVSKGITEAYKKASPEAGFDLGDILSPAREIYAPAAENSTFGPTPMFIHIRNARILTPGGSHPIPNAPGMWWRGRLSEVSGFSLGTMTQG